MSQVLQFNIIIFSSKLGNNFIEFLGKETHVSVFLKCLHSDHKTILYTGILIYAVQVCNVVHGPLVKLLLLCLLVHV